MSLIDRLDKYYYNKKSSEVWFMAILVAILVGYLLYTLFISNAINYKQKQQKINIELKNSINVAQNFLNSITVNKDKEFYIKKYNKEIALKKRELNRYRQKLSKLKGVLKELNNIFYTKDNWSKFLHNITIKAKENDLKLFKITNKEIESNSSGFKKVLEIKIKAQGRYGNILSFIKDVEENDLVTNVSTLVLKATSTKPIVDINFSVWGVKP